MSLNQGEIERAIDRLERPVGRECGFCAMHPVNDAGAVEWGHMSGCPVWVTACEARRLQAENERLERFLAAQSDSIKAYEDEVERLNFLVAART